MKKEEAQKLAEGNLRQLHESLKAGKSDRLKEYLRAVGSFPNYSLRNVMMIVQQYPEATIVSGFYGWRKLGRTVRKKESGIGVFAPIIGKRDKSDQEVAKGNPIGFRVVHVFDISQTEGKELPDLPKPSGSAELYSSKLQAIFEEHQIHVVEQELPPGTLGRSYGGRIAVQPGQSDASRFQVLVHELAHELMHRNHSVLPAKNVRETEAESVAYAVCSACGIDCLDHASDYIGMLDGNQDTFESSMSRIFKTSSQIIQSLMS